MWVIILLATYVFGAIFIGRLIIKTANMTDEELSELAVNKRKKKALEKVISLRKYLGNTGGATPGLWALVVTVFAACWPIILIVKLVKSIVTAVKGAKNENS